jgi:flagellin FlaB
MHIVRTITNQMRHQRGITGLETAIIMIAFVVVASVFSYTVLSAGIFSSEKSKSAIYAGLSSVQSTMEIVGPIVGKDTDDDDDIDQIVFIVKNSLGGDGINWTATADSDSDGLLSDETTLTHTTVITYIDTVQEVTDLAWTKTAIGKDDSDDVLDENEKFEITVNVAHLTTKIDADTSFTLEIRQRDGASMVFERTTGAVIDVINDLR